MPYAGYADLDQRIPPFTELATGALYAGFGGGPFALAPLRCALARRPDSRLDFRFELVRTPVAAGESYGELELRLAAEYRAAELLPSLRSLYPQATIAPMLLTGWAFRLVSGPATSAALADLAAPLQLASNNLGAARLVTRFAASTALVLEDLLHTPRSTLYALAEAQLAGVSPRLPLVVRFRTSDLLPAIARAAATADGVLPWSELVALLQRAWQDLPLDLSGDLAAIRFPAFGESLADRLVARFGAYVPAPANDYSPHVKLAVTPGDDTDFIWSLSQPFLAERRLTLHFDLLEELHEDIQVAGYKPYIRRRTGAALFTRGRSDITVFANLPAHRVGVESLGATITFPPKPPLRPVAKSVTVQLESPHDLTHATVDLAPGEPLDYEVTTFAIIASGQDVLELQGTPQRRRGHILSLSPDDFPLHFAAVEVTPALGALAMVAGICRYTDNAREVDLPFTLAASGRFSGLSAGLALPRSLTAFALYFTLTDRTTGRTLAAGPFETLHTRLDLTSFPEYGSHLVTISCDFAAQVPGAVAAESSPPDLYAIDLLPSGALENDATVTTLTFTPTAPSRDYRWFAHSPFLPGFRYRPHHTTGPAAPWCDVPSAVTQLVITPDSAPASALDSLPAVAESARVTHPAAPVAVTIGIETASSAETTSGAPLSPDPQPSDLLLFSAPDNAGLQYYMPRYSLATELVSGAEQYRLAIGQQGTAWTLTAYLTAAPAPPLAEAARTAQELPHDLSLALTYLQAPPAGARKSLDFQELSRSGTLVTARIAFASLQERDEVYLALTDPQRAASLVATRTCTLAVPDPNWANTYYNAVKFAGALVMPNLMINNLADTFTLAPAGVLSSAAFALNPETVRRRELAGAAAPTDPVLGISLFGIPVRSQAPGAASPALAPLRENFALPAALPPVAAVGPVEPFAPLALNTFDVGLPQVEPVEPLAPVEADPPLIIKTLQQPVDLLYWKGIRNDLLLFPSDLILTLPPALPVPQLAFTGKDNAGAGEFVTCRLAVTNWQEFPPELFAAAPTLPPCGANTNASRTFVSIFDAATDGYLYGFCALSAPQDLSQLWFAVAGGSPAPSDVYITIEDRSAGITQRSNTVTMQDPIPPSVPYRETRIELVQEVEPVPFAFVPALHSYMFQGVTAAGQAGGLVRYSLQWGDTYFTYLQDRARPATVYYLPDEFRIARRREAPYVPNITVRIISQEGLDDTAVVFDYRVAPYTDPHRLQDARTQLLADPSFGAQSVTFKPFITSDVRLTISRPTVRGAVREERARAALLLQGTYSDSLPMTLPEFQLIFDTMQRGTASLFLGEVEIALPGQGTETLPFTASLQHLAGEIFLYTAAANADGSIAVTLTNAIESPVRINTLGASVRYGAHTIPAELRNLTLPITSLPSGATCTVTVVPAAPSPDGSPPQVIFDLDGVTVLADPTAILEAVVDRSVSEFYDVITVRAVAQQFAAPPDRPDAQIVTMYVEFEGGSTVALAADHLEGAARINYPPLDVIQRRAVDNSYAYRVTAIRVDGSQLADREPRRHTTRILSITLPPAS